MGSRPPSLLFLTSLLHICKNSPSGWRMVLLSKCDLIFTCFFFSFHSACFFLIQGIVLEDRGVSIAALPFWFYNNCTSIVTIKVLCVFNKNAIFTPKEWQVIEWISHILELMESKLFLFSSRIKVLHQIFYLAGHELVTTLKGHDFTEANASFPTAASLKLL